MRIIPALAATAAIALGACGSGDSQSASTTTSAATSSASGGAAVTIKVFDFQPDPLVVPAGTEVTWTNEDEILHTVTAGTRETPGGDFDAELDGRGTTFSHTFEEPGEYAYFCNIHPGPGMTAVITVE